MSANDIRELENMDRIPAENGGDLYLVNGNMLPLEKARVFAKANTEEEEKYDESEEVLCVEKSVRHRRTDACALRSDSGRVVV